MKLRQHLRELRELESESPEQSEDAMEVENDDTEFAEKDDNSQDEPSTEEDLVGKKCLLQYSMSTKS